MAWQQCRELYRGNNLMICVVQATKMLLRRNVATNQKRVKDSKDHFISFKKVFLIKMFRCNENSKPQQLKDPEITSDFLALAQ